MNRHSMLTLIATAVAWLWIALPPGNAAAQPGVLSVNVHEQQ